MVSRSAFWVVRSLVLLGITLGIAGLIKGLCISFVYLRPCIIFLVVVMPENSSAESGTSDSLVYPIRTVASITRVSVLRLRAWERRYGLIRPKRTGGGHRVYSRQDIDRIFRILELMESGVAIGQVKQALAAESASGRGRTQEMRPWAEYRARMATAVSQFDEDLLEDVYTEMASLYPIERITNDAFLPLLAEFGQRWRNVKGVVAQEHFLAVYLRNKFGARFHHRRRGGSGPKLIVACLPGELHDTGALLFSLAAHDKGFRLVLLGANMPVDELAHTATASQAAGIVLSGSVEPEPEWFAQAFTGFVVESAIPVFVGGPVSLLRHDDIARAGAVPVGCNISASLDVVAANLVALPGQSLGALQG